MLDIVHLGLSNYKTFLFVVTNNKSLSFSGALFVWYILCDPLVAVFYHVVVLHFFEAGVETESKRLWLNYSILWLDSLICGFDPCL